VKRIGRLENGQGRKQNKVERARETNKEENNVKEETLAAAFNDLILQFGEQKIVTMLNDKIQLVAKLHNPDNAAALAFTDKAGLLTLLAQEDNAETPTAGQQIREIMKKELRRLNTTSLYQWISNTKPAAPETTKTYEQDPANPEITEAATSLIDQAIKNGELPALDQNAISKITPFIGAAIAPFFTGGGVGASFAVDKTLLSSISLGVGMSGDRPGIVIDFSKVINLGKNTKATINAGAANFIPFASVGLEQVLNGKKFNDLKANHITSARIHGDITPLYM
jgi:hypothetical protein